jgi:hypothetical protein
MLSTPVAVGYGREAEDGTQTLGGRSVNELSTNITINLLLFGTNELTDEQNTLIFVSIQNAHYDLIVYQV